MPIEKLTELQYTSEDDLFPVLVYEFDNSGRYGHPLRIPSLEGLNIWMKGNLPRILEKKLEIRITDTGDLLCFHAKNGRILYDGKRHFPEGEPGNGQIE